MEFIPLQYFEEFGFFDTPFCFDLHLIDVQCFILFWLTLGAGVESAPVRVLSKNV